METRRMDAADLKVFEAVARTGGMNRAAAELHTVQSNVTARVRALEVELGCPLFERHSRGVALTSAGQRLLPYARRVAELFGTDHHEIVVQPDVVALLPKLLWHMDEPIADTAFITTYLVSEFAHREVALI